MGWGQRCRKQELALLPPGGLGGRQVTRHSPDRPSPSAVWHSQDSQRTKGGRPASVTLRLPLRRTSGLDLKRVLLTDPPPPPPTHTVLVVGCGHFEVYQWSYIQIRSALTKHALDCQGNHCKPMYGTTSPWHILNILGRGLWDGGGGGYGEVTKVVCSL